MTVYGNSTLYNLEVQQQAREAQRRDYLPDQRVAAIIQAHPVDLYQPNIAVRLGMSFLTVFIVLAVVGLGILVISGSSAYGSFMVTVGIACYSAAEAITGQKRHYNSGVDNTLLIAVPLLVVSGLGMDMNNAETLLSFLSFIICSWLTIRFADKLMGMIAVISFLMFGFYAYVNLGEFTISTYPFIILLLAALVYYASGKGMAAHRLLVYHHVLAAIRVIAMIAFYLGGNYYFIHQLTDDTYLLQADSPLRMAWFFWSWTMLLPVVYVVKGIRSKDVILLRLGVVFVAAAILTYRYFYAILPAEIAMMIAGAIVVALAYWLIKYLQQPKHGFVFAEDDNAGKDIANVEALLVGEAFSHQQSGQEDATTFGGGSFGGAGAGSNY